MAAKIRVAVLFGGRSTEHEISIITGQEIISAFDTTRYTPFPVYIDQRGRWFIGEQLLRKDFYKGLPGCLDELKEVALLPRPGSGGLTVLGKKGLSSLFSKEEVVPVDVFVPAFHGQFGEDGCIQGLFEMADVVYTGCNVLASSIAMNKYLCKSVLNRHGIPVLPAVVVRKSSTQKNLEKVRADIRSTRGLEEFPLFVKPLNLGSSVGVGKAENDDELDAALANAFQFDTEVLIEPCIANKLEINVSVRDCPEPVASVVEIPVSSGDVLSYEDKYLRGGKGKKGKASGAAAAGTGQAPMGMASLTRVVDPQDLDPKHKQGVIACALDAYRVLSCSGVVRFDFMVDLNTESLYFNELNPLPGSLAHYLWDKSSPRVLYPELLHDMVQAAFRKREEVAGLKRDFGFKALFR